MLERQLLTEMFRRMLLIRSFEERIKQVYAEGLMAGLAHLYDGEEAVAVGACAALKPTDYITSTHRGHGHCIAKGGDVRRMMAEVMGRETGYCRGKGGSMHIFDLSLGILGANGIVAGGLPIATGAALQAKLRKTGQVVVAFFGDAATNQGTFHESVNMAGLWRLPVVYVCENNLYGISVSQARHQAVRDVAVRAEGYGMPGVVADGMDVLDVYAKVREAVARARRGEGPTLVECKTYRYGGHHCGEPGTAYRAKEEIAAWRDRDPLRRFRAYLTEHGVLTADEAAKLEREAAALLDEAVEYGKAGPWPAPEEALEDVYAE